MMIGIFSTLLGLFRLGTVAAMMRAQGEPSAPARAFAGRIRAVARSNPNFDFTNPGPQTISTERRQPEIVTMIHAQPCRFPCPRFAGRGVR